jgi:FkbM family methyltransferase
MKTYSQYKQDMYVFENFFKNKQNGFFVDIGAHDGITYSNSLFFEEQGWNGICVEPLPHIYKKLKLNRKCKCIEGAVSNKEISYVEFCAIEGYSEMLSGILDSYDDRHKARILNEEQIYKCNRKKIKVPCLNFNKIIDNTKIDFLSIDTEGSELDILKTIDFTKYDISLIAVENNFSEPHILNFLKEKNFIYITALGTDQIFKNEKHLL